MKGFTDIVLDITGLKVYGAGGRRAKQYGGEAIWIKIHAALDTKTGKLVVAEATEETNHGTTYFEKASKEANLRKRKVLIDEI